MHVILSLLTLVSLSNPDTVSSSNIPIDREALLNGAGMGLAAYAEMNGYPGPKHVLDLKGQLGLSQDQLKKTETLFTSVQASAKLTGEDIVKEEENLNRLFETGKINERLLRASVERIARLRGVLRLIHMQAHVKMKSILSEAQIHIYNESRKHAGH